MNPELHYLERKRVLLLNIELNFMIDLTCKSVIIKTDKKIK
jgi:hypothetical protein